MLFPDTLVLLRGGGDLATGVAYRLHTAGFPVIVLELPQPLVVRRRVALATAVSEGEVTIETLRGVRVESAAAALALAQTGAIPVLVSPELPPELTTDDGRRTTAQTVLVDARIAKRNIDTRIDQADLVIALGPGFTAGVDCHAVVETMRGHRLGRVIWQGSALPDTGVPETIGGRGSERVLRAPASGRIEWLHEIGDIVDGDALLGIVSGAEIRAPFGGVIRGLVAPGTLVSSGMKVGDIDARGDVSACFTISDKSLAIGGGVLETILTYFNRNAEALS